MSFGAGLVAAKKAGAAEIVDPQPYAVGSIEATYRKYPNAAGILPAMGYGDAQVAELAETISRTPCDVVVVGTPIDLTRVLKLAKPAVRVRYELREVVPGRLAEELVRAVPAPSGRRGSAARRPHGFRETRAGFIVPGDAPPLAHDPLQRGASPLQPGEERGVEPRDVRRRVEPRGLRAQLHARRVRGGRRRRGLVHDREPHRPRPHPQGGGRPAARPPQPEPRDPRVRERASPRPRISRGGSGTTWRRASRRSAGPAASRR